MTNVFMVADHALYSAAIWQLISLAPQFKLVGWESDPRTAARSIRIQRPDVVVFLTPHSISAATEGWARAVMAGQTCPYVVISLENTTVLTDAGERIPVDSAGELFRVIERPARSSLSGKGHMMSNQKQSSGMSRRDFLKTSSMGVAAAAVSANLIPVTAATAQSSAKGVAFPASWATPPVVIEDSQIVETINADVVVVGAGVAGLSAAARAAELGATVAVIEKSATFSARGGGLGVVTSRIMREEGIELDKEELAREWIEMCANRADESLVWLFLNNSGDAMDWWLDKAEPYNMAHIIWGGYYKGPNYAESPAYHMFFGGPAAADGKSPGAELGYVLYNDAVEKGVNFYWQNPGEQLVKDGDRVVGVITNTADGYKKYLASKGVILATGDIGGNPEMCADLAPLALRPDHSDYTPIGVNTGDGHRMGLWAGGAFQDAPFPTMIHPQGFAWFSPGCYPHINLQGNRYMNEDTWVQARSLGVFRNPGAPYAWAVIDADWPEVLTRSVETGGGMFWDSFRGLGADFDPGYFVNAFEGYKSRGWYFEAETLEDLAAQIDVPADQFVASIQRYNELVEGGQDLDFGKRAEQFFAKVEKGPFIALKFGPALLTVVGGLNTDTHLRVVNAEHEPVPGLYAVGNVSGGVYGSDYPIQIPGNSHTRALTWGYLAGKNVLED